VPPAVATASLIAPAARALHEAGHPVIAEALLLFLAGADFEAALGLGSGWRAYPRYAAQQQALGALLAALPPTTIVVQAARQISEVLCRYETVGWREARVAGRRPGGVNGLAYDCLSAGTPMSVERLRRRIIPLVTVSEAATSTAA
jgi:hypothetical protein